VRAAQSPEADLGRLLDNTKAVLMLSVPHSGSSLASVSPSVRPLLLPSVEVDELQKGTVSDSRRIKVSFPSQTT